TTSTVATTFSGGVLTINYSAANQAVTVNAASGVVSLTGAVFSGAGFGPFTSVARIVVSDPGTVSGQSLSFTGSGTLSLAGGLLVTGIESAAINQPINASAGTLGISITAPQSIDVEANLTGGTTAGVTLVGQGAAPLPTTGVTVGPYTITAPGSAG